MIEEDGKKTTPNASHDTFRGLFGIGHALRHKGSDMEMTKDYYTTNPPQVGDKVVIIATASHSEMWPPEHCVIEAITDRGRIVVDHDSKWGSGKSFYKSGQNCMKPKGQTWLIPSALYVEDYISGDDARRHRTEQMKGKTIHDVQIERENDCIDTAKARWNQIFGIGGTKSLESKND